MLMWRCSNVVIRNQKIGTNESVLLKYNAIVKILNLKEDRKKSITCINYCWLMYI